MTRLAATGASLAIAALARRTGVFVLPRDACGLRQPVHVDDLAERVSPACSRTGTCFCCRIIRCRFICVRTCSS